MKELSLINVIKDDHKEILTMYNQYVAAHGDHEAQGRWARLLTWEIARHSVGEEIVVYPLLEKHLGSNGKKLAERDLEEHQYVKDQLYKLESLTPGESDHSQTVKDIMDHLRIHIQSEENFDLPQLEKALGEEYSRQAAQSFQRTKQFVPTRAHPDAPNKPPYETVVGLLQAPIDKLKDYYSTFPSKEEMDAAGLN